MVDLIRLHRDVDAAADPLAPAQVRLRGRNVLVLVLAPEFPVGDWFAGLDRLMREAPKILADRPILADLTATLAEGGSEAVGIVLDGLEARNLKLVGVDGIERKSLPARWKRLATRMYGRDLTLDGLASKDSGEARPAGPAEPEPAAAAVEPAPAPSAPAEAEAAAAPGPGALLIDRQVRSGESIVFPNGDVTIIGSVSSGAEVLAGGSIHVYGVLRGRAVAGLKTGAGARIFCRRLEAEMVGVDHLYRTAEHWGRDLHGRAVQVFCDRGSLRLMALD